MGQWKKILTSGSAAEVTTLEATSTVVLSGIAQDTSPSNLVSADSNGNITYTPSSNFMPSSGGSTAGEFIFWSGSLSQYGTASTTATAATDLIRLKSSGGSSPRPELAITGSLQGNADSADVLSTARNIGGVSFDGSANINLPGVNTSGNQNTSGKAATAGTADQVANSLTDGGGISDFTYNGSAAVTIAVDSTVVRTSGTQIISGSKTFHNNASFDGNVTVDGDLFINGTSTVVNTANLTVEDKFVIFASGSTAGNTQGGIVVATGVVSGTTVQKGDAFYRTATGRWGFASDVREDATLVNQEAYAPAIQIIHTGDPVNPDTAPTTPAYGLGDMYMDRATGELFVWSEALGSGAPPAGSDPGTSGGQIGG